MPGDDVAVNIAIGEERIERVNLRKVKALLPELKLKITNFDQQVNLIMTGDVGATHVVLEVDDSKDKGKISKKKQKEIIDKAIEILRKKRNQKLL